MLTGGLREDKSMWKIVSASSYQIILTTESPIRKNKYSLIKKGSTEHDKKCENNLGCIFCMEDILKEWRSEKYLQRKRN